MIHRHISLSMLPHDSSHGEPMGPSTPSTTGGPDTAPRRPGGEAARGVREAVRGSGCAAHRLTPRVAARPGRRGRGVRATRGGRSRGVEGSSEGRGAGAKRARRAATKRTRRAATSIGAMTCSRSDPGAKRSEDPAPNEAKRHTGQTGSRLRPERRVPVAKTRTNPPLGRVSRRAELTPVSARRETNPAPAGVHPVSAAGAPGCSRGTGPPAPASPRRRTGSGRTPSRAAGAGGRGPRTPGRARPTASSALTCWG
jgi:hypothetical protein